MNNKTILLTAIVLMLGIVIASCKKDDPSTVTPTLVSETKNVHSTYVEFEWSIDFPGSYQSGVELSLREDMSDSTQLYQGTQSGNNFKVNIENLIPNTNYYYRIVVWNPARRDVFAISGFKTDSGVPALTTDEPSDVTQTTATLGGVIISDNGIAVTSCGVCWSTSKEPTINDQFMEVDVTVDHFTVNVSGLTPETKYYARAYATNRAGTGYGNEVRFTTGVADAVSVTIEEIDYYDWEKISANCNLMTTGVVTIFEKGVCFGTSPDPEYNGQHVGCGTESGLYNAVLSELTPGTLYYIRAYATFTIDRGLNVVYSDSQTITTTAVPQTPEGAVGGFFSINEKQKVWFSNGNLQYQANTNTWKFAENQYDVIGDDNSNISISNTGWIDLFGWGTSGWNSGASCCQPWSTSASNSDYYPGGSFLNDLTGNYAKADWGVYNEIVNGGNQSGLWRTLTREEWVYVFNTRSTTSGIRFAKAQVNGVNGVILLPDNWNSSYCSLSSTNSTGASYTSNTISASNWSTLEQHGAVFLPAAGYRSGTSVYNDYGYYWSASHYDGTRAYDVYFYGLGLKPSNNFQRHAGNSVRLVRNAQ